MSELIKFPCQFAIKVIGMNCSELINEVIAIVSSKCENFNPNTDITSNVSNKANYLSLTVNVYTTSQEHLDDIYRSLNKHELVRITL